MNWFFIAFIGYLCLALTFILDKFILEKSVPKPVVYTFYSTVFSFAIILVFPFGVEFLNNIFDWFIAIISGLAFGFAMWTQFLAVKNNEASHINPFLGGFVTIATYLLSNHFLNEKLTDSQIFGIVILIFACFLLSFEKTKKTKFSYSGFVWAIVSGLLYAISHVSAKYLYNIYPFLTALVWSKSSVGILSLFLLFSPTVLKSFKHQKKTIKQQESKAKKFSLVIVSSAKILGLLAVFLIQYASAIGSVSIVMAMSGLQYVLMFLLIIIATKIIPKIFNEYFTKKELVIEWIAIVLSLFASIFIII